MEGLVSLVYPSLCIACNNSIIQREECLCLNCLWQAGTTDHFHIAQNEMINRLAGRIELQHAASLFHFTKSGSFQHVIHALKYEGNYALGTHLGRVAGNKLLDSKLFSKPDYIIPIPIHRKRKRKRRYNQSAMFGKGISQVTGIPHREDILVKHQNISSQTTATRIARIQNVYDSFRLFAEKLTSGVTVLLVDDVITTGATLEAAYHKLNQIPDIQIQILTMAMAHD